MSSSDGALSGASCRSSIHASLVSIWLRFSSDPVCDELRALLEFLQIDNANRRGEGWPSGSRARFGAIDMQLSEDDLAGIQRLADFQDGSFGEDHPRPQRQAPVNLLAIFPRQDQKPAVLRASSMVSETLSPIQSRFGAFAHRY